MLNHVTSYDIKNGERHAPRRCPVALAIARQMKGRVRALFVGSEAIDLLFQNGWTRIKDPAILKKVNHFDDTGHMEPFSLEVEEPKLRERPRLSRREAKALDEEFKS